jgi:hypothetical protein
MPSRSPQVTLSALLKCGPLLLMARAVACAFARMLVFL